jgi:hypothetical protein
LPFGFTPSLADPFPHRYVPNVQLLIPGKPRNGNSAIADQGFRKFGSKPSEEILMAFVNEVVSDEDIAQYKLPFAPSTNCYWTRDLERDSYLWGVIIRDDAKGYDPEGRFDFFIRNSLFSIVLELGDGSVSFRDVPYRVIWNSIRRVQPRDFAGINASEAISTLKEALICYGYDGRRNLFAPYRRVTFNF